MALYELDDNQAKNTINWLKGITINANFEDRQRFDAELKGILSALNNPINPIGKKKEQTE